MGEKELLNVYFTLEQDIIDEKYYDPARIDINLDDGVNNLREKFNIYKTDISSTKKVYDKIADGAGHYRKCSYYIIEITASNIAYAILQLKRTFWHIYDNGASVDKVAIILDENRWHDKLSRKIYKIENHLLFKRRKNNNEQIYIIFEGERIAKDIYCYLVNFSNYGLE